MTEAAARPAYKRKLFWVALLYFSEGLPLGVFYDIFPVYFRQQGVNLAEACFPTAPMTMNELENRLA